MPAFFPHSRFVFRYWGRLLCIAGWTHAAVASIGNGATIPEFDDCRPDGVLMDWKRHILFDTPRPHWLRHVSPSHSI